MDAVRELNYIPNTTARALRSSQTRCIGVLLDYAVSHQRYSRVLDGIRSVLEKNSYNVLLCSAAYTDAHIPGYISCYLRHEIDGLIYMGRDGSPIPQDELRLISEHGIPVTALDCGSLPSDISSVEFDYYHGALNHAYFLIKHGAKRLLYLRPDIDTLQERERESGLQNALCLSPEISLVTERVPGHLLLSNDYHLHEGNSRPLFAHLQDAVRQRCGQLSGRDAVICSWGLYIEPVYAAAMLLSPALQIAGLASGSLNPQGWKNLSYSVLPNYQAGVLCAELTMRRIARSAAEKQRLETHIVHSEDFYDAGFPSGA